MEPRLNGIWPQTSLRHASKLESVMEFGFNDHVCVYSATQKVLRCAVNWGQKTSKPFSVRQTLPGSATRLEDLRAAESSRWLHWKLRSLWRRVPFS